MKLDTQEVIRKQLELARSKLVKWIEQKLETVLMKGISLGESITELRQLDDAVHNLDVGQSLIKAEVSTMKQMFHRRWGQANAANYNSYSRSPSVSPVPAHIILSH